MHCCIFYDVIITNPSPPPLLPSQNSSRLSERSTVFLLPGVHVLFSLPAVEMVGEVRSHCGTHTHSELHLSSENGYNMKGCMMISFNKWHQRAKHLQLGRGTSHNIKTADGWTPWIGILGGDFKVFVTLHLDVIEQCTVSLGEQYFRVCQCHCYALVLQGFFVCSHALGWL